MATINIHIFIIVKYNDFDYLNKRYRMDGSRNKNPETTLGREIGRQTGDLHLSPCSSKYNSTVSFRGPQNASFLLPHAPPPYSFPMDLSDLPHLSSFSWLLALCQPSSPAGTLWEHTGHTGLGITYANCRSSPFCLPQIHCDAHL